MLDILLAQSHNLPMQIAAEQWPPSLDCGEVSESQVKRQVAYFYIPGKIITPDTMRRSSATVCDGCSWGYPEILLLLTFR